MRLSLSKDLAPLRAIATQTIDAAAESIRGYFITQGSGQAMVYQQKLVEAEAVTADPGIAPGEVPHIAREAELNAITLLDQAAIIITMADQWKQVSAVIESLRLGAKETVATASTPAQIDTATQIDWSPVLP